VTRLVVTIPCHNEGKFLQDAVQVVRGETQKLSNDFVVVLAEDGSTDETPEVARKLAIQYPDVVHIHYQRKLGRGKALKNAWRRTDGDIYVYFDCDLATDMKHYKQLIKLISDGNHLVTGSRYSKGAKVERPFLRLVISKIYNVMIRLLLQDDVNDHQCGFKAFSRKLIIELLPECRSDDWFWDTEIIVLARKKGYKIIEIPVEWKEKRRLGLQLRRLVRDIVVHGTATIQLLFRK